MRLLGPCALAFAVGAPGVAHATWSIAAVDATSGDVGVAVASCVDFRLDPLVSLASGAAGVSQGLFTNDNRHALTQALEGRGADSSADEVAAAQAAGSRDDQRRLRQYGVVIEGGAEASYTGSGVPEWSGSARSAGVAVQGNSLVSKRVVDDALAAFEGQGDAPLSDRLMAGLTAGSAAGGDRRCNVGGIRQTASSAAIVVAPRGTKPFDGATAVQPGIKLHMVEVDGAHRINAVDLLRRTYLGWRSRHLEGDAPTFARVPLGDRSATTVVGAARRPVLRWVLGALVLLAAIALFVRMWRGPRAG